MGWQTITFLDHSTEEYATDPLMAGAQGEIFLSRDGQNVIKLYHNVATDLKERAERIRRLIDDFNPTKNDPFWREFFTWPDKLVTAPRLGYRMRFAGGMHTMDYFVFERSFRSLADEEKGWFMGRVASSIKLVSAAQRMSATGISYPDFSLRNIMVEPFEGRMTLIDCDSITIPQMMAAEVVGTPMFLAPELWTGQQRVPSVTSDRHALATILYIYLTGWHPLYGDKIFDVTDPERDDKLRHGQGALYVEDPNDPSNRANGQQIKASHLGYDIEAVFRQAFVDGLHHSTLRPQPNDWLQALSRTYDRIVPCETAACVWHSFVALPTGRIECPSCKTPLRGAQMVPFVYLLPHRNTSNAEDYDDIISRDKHYVVGWPGRTLHQWHTAIGKPPPHSRARKRPDDDPQVTFLYDNNTGIWYLRNEILPNMRYQDQQRQWQPLPPTAAVPLTNTMLLQFGAAPEAKRAKVVMKTP